MLIKLTTAAWVLNTCKCEIYKATYEKHTHNRNIFKLSMFGNCRICGAYELTLPATSRIHTYMHLHACCCWTVRQWWLERRLAPFGNTSDSKKTRFRANCATRNFPTIIQPGRCETTLTTSTWTSACVERLPLTLAKAVQLGNLTLACHRCLWTWDDVIIAGQRR